MWDLSVSIGYMLYRSFGGAVDGSTIQLTPTLTAYFAVHGAVAVAVMSLEVAVLALGILLLRRRAAIGRFKWHSRLAKVLFPIWWVAFLSGEIFYLVMYVL